MIGFNFPTNFTVKASGAGVLYVQDVAGRTVATYNIAAGSTQVMLPAMLKSGIYMGLFVGDDGCKKAIRISYVPQ